VLKTLGELQLIVDYAYYRKDRAQGDSTMGWRRVQCIKDLAQIVPSPGPEDAERLLQTWRTSVETLNTDVQSAAKISDEIYATRQDMVAIIQGLRWGDICFCRGLEHERPVHRDGYGKRVREFCIPAMAVGVAATLGGYRSSQGGQRWRTSPCGC
jgi:hypothetical protein